MLTGSKKMLKRSKKLLEGSKKIAGEKLKIAGGKHEPIIGFIFWSNIFRHKRIF